MTAALKFLASVSAPAVTAWAGNQRIILSSAPEVTNRHNELTMAGASVCTNWCSVSSSVLQLTFATKTDDDTERQLVHTPLVAHVIVFIVPIFLSLELRGRNIPPIFSNGPAYQRQGRPSCDAGRPARGRPQRDLLGQDRRPQPTIVTSSSSATGPGGTLIWHPRATAVACSAEPASDAA